MRFVTIVLISGLLTYAFVGCCCFDTGSDDKTVRETVEKQPPPVEEEEIINESRFRFSIPGDQLRPIEGMFIVTKVGGDSIADDISEMTLSEDGHLDIHFSTINTGGDSVLRAIRDYYFLNVYEKNDFPQVTKLTVTAFDSAIDPTGSKPASKLMTVSLPSNIGKGIDYNNPSLDQFLSVAATQGEYKNWIAE
jgi:hypothetical protein